MSVYFTIRKSPTEALTVIFDADGFGRATQYKQGLVRDRAYREDQIEISGTDANGQLVRG